MFEALAETKGALRTAEPGLLPASRPPGGRAVGTAQTLDTLWEASEGRAPAASRPPGLKGCRPPGPACLVCPNRPGRQGARTSGGGRVTGDRSLVVAPGCRTSAPGEAIR